MLRHRCVCCSCHRWPRFKTTTDRHLQITGLLAAPPYVGTLWRGVNVNLSATYIVDTIFRWWRFSSCTTDGKAREPPFSQAKRAVCDPWYPS